MPKRTRTFKARNNALADHWSFVHLLTGVLLGGLLNPWLTLLLMVLWEPFEILLLSRILAKQGIVFGDETWRNSLSDIIFDAVGITIGYFTLHNALTGFLQN